MRRFGIYILLGFIIVILGGGFLFWRVNQRVVDLEAQVLKQTIEIQATQKQIPLLTKYWILVKELTDASQGRLTAFEIVEISRIIITECQVNQDIGLTPALVMSVMRRESAFSPDVVSVAKAYGLMQVTRTIFELHLRDVGYAEFAVNLALDPIVNVRVGIKELIRLRQYWIEEGIEKGEGDWKISLYSYYAGTRWAWRLMTTLKKERFPGLEYSIGTIKLVEEYKKKGL